MCSEYVPVDPEQWQRDFWQRVRENDRREFDETGKAKVTDDFPL